ncbi:hypothetical protein SDJN03_10349, partial [Cucurbita argyrosperma subsp. sororia]
MAAPPLPNPSSPANFTNVLLRRALILFSRRLSHRRRTASYSHSVCSSATGMGKNYPDYYLHSKSPSLPRHACQENPLGQDCPQCNQELDFWFQDSYMAALIYEDCCTKQIEMLSKADNRRNSSTLVIHLRDIVKTAPSCICELFIQVDAAVVSFKLKQAALSCIFLNQELLSQCKPEALTGRDLKSRPLRWPVRRLEGKTEGVKGEVDWRRHGSFHMRFDRTMQAM